MPVTSRPKTPSRLPAVRAWPAFAALLVVFAGCATAVTTGTAASNEKTTGPWQETESGLRYRVLEEGFGPIPKTGDQVVCDYKGWLDGKRSAPFDSSYARGEPATFPVGGLIRGWNEALVMMPMGSRWQLRIPPSLGYGKAGSPPEIPGGSTLNFILELHEVLAR